MDICAAIEKNMDAYDCEYDTYILHPKDESESIATVSTIDYIQN